MFNHQYQHTLRNNKRFRLYNNKLRTWRDFFSRRYRGLSRLAKLILGRKTQPRRHYRKLETSNLKFKQILNSRIKQAYSVKTNREDSMMALMRRVSLTIISSSYLNEILSSQCLITMIVFWLIFWMSVNKINIVMTVTFIFKKTK